VAAALAGAPPTLECIPAPSAGSIMAGSPDPIPSEDSPVLVASTEGASAVEGSMAGAAEASMVEAEAGDSSNEVMKHDTRNDKNDK
jgi:hypothetical protein